MQLARRQEKKGPNLATTLNRQKIPSAQPKPNRQFETRSETTENGTDFWLFLTTLAPREIFSILASLL